MSTNKMRAASIFSSQCESLFDFQSLMDVPDVVTSCCFEHAFFTHKNSASPRDNARHCDPFGSYGGRCSAACVLTIFWEEAKCVHAFYHHVQLASFQVFSFLAQLRPYDGKRNITVQSASPRRPHTALHFCLRLDCFERHQPHSDKSLNMKCGRKDKYRTNAGALANSSPQGHSRLL